MQRVGVGFVILAGLIAPNIGAEVLQQPRVTPISQQGGEFRSVPRPVNGMPAADVERRFGPPREKTAAVGNPPISRWVYDHFTVYFEYQLVLHSVVHQQ